MDQFSTDKTDKQFRFDSGSGLWFTSDLHFSHANILRFCNRPFRDTDHMNAMLIKNWNERVAPEDIIFILGDFAWGGSTVWTNILNQLNGHKYLIIGNHDEKNLRQNYSKYFDWIGYQMHLQIEGRSVYLNHYPFLCYGGSYRNPDNAVWQLYGHVHSKEGQTGQDKERLKYLFPYQYDVGVDNNNYTPVSWDEIKTIINKQVENAQK